MGTTTLTGKLEINRYYSKTRMEGESGAVRGHSAFTDLTLCVLKRGLHSYRVSGHVPFEFNGVKVCLKDTSFEDKKDGRLRTIGITSVGKELPEYISEWVTG